MKTSEAFLTILRCICIIAVNSWKSLNKAAHKYPWIFIVSIGIIATILSCINIGNARSERDKANATMIKMQQRIDTMQCVIDNKTYKYGTQH